MTTDDDYDPSNDADNEAEDAVAELVVDKNQQQQQQEEEEFQKIVKITEAPNASNRKKKADNVTAATQDEKLKQFLANADEIESIEHFTYWKDEFLDTFRQYLDPIGTATAREADEEIYHQLEKLAQVCLDVKGMVNEGNITPDRCSVKGQRAINEMFSWMSKVETKIDGYWPKKQEEEEKLGYTKFELAAVLVRDGFRVYGLMVATRDYVESLAQGALKEIIKPNQQSITQYYFRSLDSFTQTMADLGMYKLMQKCVEIYKVRPRTKKKKKYDRTQGDALSDSSMSDTINKGRMFAKSKKKFKSIMDNGWTSGVNRQQVKGHNGQSKGGKKKSKSSKNGKDGENGEDGSGTESSTTDDADGKNKVEEDEEEEEEEEVEWIYYFDSTNETVGKVPRAKCIEERLILTVDGTGKEKADGMIEEWDSKDGVPGKTEIINQLKELLRGKAKGKVEGLISPPESPVKASR